MSVVCMHVFHIARVQFIFVTLDQELVGRVFNTSLMILLIIICSAKHMHRIPKDEHLQEYGENWRRWPCQLEEETSS